METPSSSSSSSFVSKAKTAFHSAAAKAERVLTDIKIDLKPDPREESEGGQSDKTSSSSSSSSSNNKKVSELNSTSKFRDGELGRKQDWHKRLKNIRRGKTGPEERFTSPNSRSNSPGIDEYLDQMDLRSSFDLKGSEKVHPVEKEDSNMPTMVTIPPASVIKQLAVAVEAGKKFKSMKDLLASARDSSPIRERAGLSFSAVKSLVLRDKEGKLNSDGDDDEVVSLSKKLFNVEGQFCIKKNLPGSAISSLPRDIHASPLDSFVVGLSEIIGRLTTLRKMASFWYMVVKEKIVLDNLYAQWRPILPTWIFILIYLCLCINYELRRLWSEEQPIPRVPLDENPNLNSCLLHQQLQVINCCISRKRRHDIATESLDSILREVGLNLDELVLSPDLAASSSVLYARINNGDLVLRLGADHPSESITMLETGEPVYSPVTQEGPVLTEDLIKETEELVLRTGSVGAGCSQLLSDMQAFKAANPGCILEDFVRWHSPPDWSETDTSDETRDCSDEGEPTSRKGYLSIRMQKEGNLWRELWDTSKPLPAIKQAPLFDEDLAVEGILDFFEEITPSELFQQLFISLLASGLVIAEGPLSMNSNFSKLFYECKDYVIATCQVNTWSNNVNNLCQVYETVETILVHPEDGLKIINQSEEATAADEPKRRFRKLIFNFGGKDRQFLRKQAPKQTKNPEENSARQGFQNLFDGKSSLFSKKPPTPKTSNPPSHNDTSFYSDEIIGQAFHTCKYSI